VRDYRQESHYSQDRRDITVISIESHIKEIKLSDLGSGVSITRNLECDCSLVISKI